MPGDTYLASCDKTIQDWIYLVKNMILIYTNIYHWGGHEAFMTNFKPALFAHLRFIELLHPTSAYCWKIDSELREYFTETQTVFDTDDRDQMVLMNTFKNLGTLMKDIAEIDECFYYWNGKCAGEKMGEIMLSLLDPSIEATHTELTGTI